MKEHKSHIFKSRANTVVVCRRGLVRSSCCPWKRIERGSQDEAPGLQVKKEKLANKIEKSIQKRIVSLSSGCSGVKIFGKKMRSFIPILQWAQEKVSDAIHWHLAM